MKRRVFLGALAWALLITLAHIQLNIGWTRLKDNAEVILGQKRRELSVGFLPVT